RPRPVQGPRADCASRDPAGTRHRGRDRCVRLRDRILQCDLRVARPDLPRTGVVDTLGYVAFNFGVRHADTTVVATAAAPYSVVPIVFGVVLLHERPRWVQWAGIGLVIGGLILLGLFA